MGDSRVAHFAVRSPRHFHGGKNEEDSAMRSTRRRARAVRPRFCARRDERLLRRRVGRPVEVQGRLRLRFDRRGQQLQGHRHGLEDLRRLPVHAVPGGRARLQRFRPHLGRRDRGLRRQHLHRQRQDRGHRVRAHRRRHAAARLPVFALRQAGRLLRPCAPSGSASARWGATRRAKATSTCSPSAPCIASSSRDNCDPGSEYRGAQ